MDRLLKPERLDVEPSNGNAETEWKHWKRTFENFIGGVANITEVQKLPLLCNYVSAKIYQFINDCTTYSAAIEILDNLFIKAKNTIYARHCLSTRNQQTGEAIDEYLQILKQLSKDCKFTDVKAETYCQEYIRDAFIRGLNCPRIRQRLLENSSLDLEKAYDQARTLEAAEIQAASYVGSPNIMSSAAVGDTDSVREISLSATKIQNCFFCGYDLHSRSVCPAKDDTCRKCGKTGHYQRVCKSRQWKNYKNHHSKVTATLSSSTTDAIRYLQKSVTNASVNGIRLNALIDTGSTLSFLNEKHLTKCQAKIRQYSGKISMANSSMVTEIVGSCRVNLRLDEFYYADVELLIMKDLCTDILIGHDILGKHSSVVVGFDGNRPPLNICSLAIAQVLPVSLFSNLSPDCKPIITKSRRHTDEDNKFMNDEIQKLLRENIIEPSSSPWRAQPFVTRGDNHKARMVIDYSLTINRFTLLDAYPLPKIQEIIFKISKNNVFSKIDLKSAYHQIPILESEKHYTAFEACGKLYQFLRVPFGVTNGVACFQRAIDQIIEAENLKLTFPYIDDVTVCGKDQKEHDDNLKRFLSAAKKYNLTLNEQKCSYATNSIQLLGYVVSNGTIKPDPERLRPLLDMPIPPDSSSLQRALGMFAHYCRWIPNFSEKIRPLLDKKTFPLSKDAISAFNLLKNDVANATLVTIKDDIPFRVETDASEFAIGATLSQAHRPVAFFSRTLNASERKHSSPEKEAYAIVESLRHWRHFLVGKHFEVFTDQQAVSFVFDQKHSSKIKNEKLVRWRLELACFKFDIIYRPGKENVVADTLSRITGALTSAIDLKELHKSLCHPGVTRMYHWIRCKNLPFSLEDIRKLTNSCPICNELKPRFCKNKGTLIKATSSFERLNLDFKGPLPSNTKNRYILTIVDEYSRFPFAIPCKDLSATTVIHHLESIFSTFGMPSYIHSDRGSAFMSRELKTYLASHGVATSRTTPYNPQGNGQVERYNGIIWKTTQLALKSNNMKIEQWELVLDSALHSIRSLLCTATNATPHERMFSHPRRSHNGCSIPTWLTEPGPVWMKKHVRSSKYEPLVQEVELIEANPDYAHVKFPDGRETTVSIKHLAPKGEIQENQDQVNEGDVDEDLTNNFEEVENENQFEPIRTDTDNDNISETQSRPVRDRRPPPYLREYVTDTIKRG